MRTLYITTFLTISQGQPVLGKADFHGRISRTGHICGLKSQRYQKYQYFLMYSVI